jgi:peptidoglycan/LPS O-acetylase OafA/YrhL
MKYYEKIDGLRFVAIVFVLIEHFADTIGHKITAGYYGVDLFFVISGFLITNILLNSKSSFLKSYKNFVGRRTLRIFPIYYLMLAFMFLIGYEPCRTNIVYLATYTFNYAWVYNKIPMSALTHFWSLAIEEQFYLFWPVFILAFRGMPKVLYSITIMIIVVCFFQLTTKYFTAVNEYNFVGLFPRAGSLCLGALGSMLWRDKKINDDFFVNPLWEWIVFAGLIVSLVATYELKYVVLALCSIFLVLKSVHSDFDLKFLNRILTNKWAIYVGTISYGIYIFHLPIGYFLTTKYVSPWWYSVDFDSLGRFSFVRYCLWVAILPAYALLSIGVASLSSRYIEKPILTLKDKLFK